MKDFLGNVIDTPSAKIIFKKKPLFAISNKTIKEVTGILRKEGIPKEEISALRRALKKVTEAEKEKRQRKKQRVHFVINESEIREKILQGLKQNPQGLICEEIGKAVYGHLISSLKNPLEYQILYRLLHGLMTEGKVTTEKIRDKVTAFGGKAKKVYKLVEK